MHDFVALDIETANDNRHSICSIGLVKFKEGKVIDTYHTLINPEEHFDAYNIMIHGITEHDVSDAPTFPELIAKITGFIGQRPVVAHFAQFDMGALRDNYERYKIDYNEIEYACSYFLTKSLKNEFINYRLNTLCEHYGILLNHHDALSDANGSGQIIINLLEENQVTTIDDLIKIADYPRFGQLGVRGFRKKHKRGPQHPKNFSRELTKEEVNRLNPNHPFYGLNFVVSGNFSGRTQNDIKEEILLAGGTPQNGGVTRQTDILVCGEQDLRVVGESGMSGKMKRAYALKEAGQNIEIITEDDFIQIIHSNN